VSDHPKRPAAIVGAATSRFRTRRDDVDLTELLLEGAVSALIDAGMTFADVDAVVLAQAPDPLHGIGHPEQTAAAALGLGGKPLVRVHTGGATGMSAGQAAWWLVTSGRFETVLVVGAERMGDNVHGAQKVLNEIWDPAYEALMPLNTIANCSLMTVRYMQRYGADEQDFAEIASRMRANGARNENAHLRIPVEPDEVLESPILTWPVRRSMSCPRSSGAAAAVIASADVTRRLAGPVAWIRGMAACTDTYFMGDRMRLEPVDEYIAMHALRRAGEAAYAMAGITDPCSQLDVAEPYIPFSSYEPMMLEALHFAPVGQAVARAREGAWETGGEVVVCPSGGVVCTNPISVTALVRLIEAAQQVRGRADGHQVDGARTAMATGAGGDAQIFGAAVLSDNPAN